MHWDVQYFRQFAVDIGFPQPHPTVIQEDNQPANNLTIAPQITSLLHHKKKSRKKKFYTPICEMNSSN